MRHASKTSMILIGIAGFRLAGRFLKHAAGLLVLGWQRMVRAAGIAALLGALGVEMLACVSTGQFPPPLLAHVVAAVLALVLAYCAALTVLLFELFAGSLEMLRLLMGDVEADARAATVAVEHEIGDVRDSLRRLVGLPPKPQRPPRQERAIAAFTLPALAARTIRKRATSISRPLVNVASRSPVSQPQTMGQPVPASRLPRIAWAYDEPITRPSAVVSPSAVPVLSESQTTAAPASPQATMAPIRETAAPATPRPRPAEGAQRFAMDADDEDLLKRGAAARIAAAQGAREPVPSRPEPIEPRPTRPLGSTTRPLGRVTRPLPEMSRLREATNSGGIWGKVSQVLVGRVEEPPVHEAAESDYRPLGDDSSTETDRES